MVDTIITTITSGVPGVGVPTGGASGQVLRKLSTTNYDTDWVTIAGGVDQFIWETIDADTGSTAASNTTDILTIEGGDNITTTIVGDTLTIDSAATIGGAVDSVNSQTGIVLLDADDISDTTTVSKYTTAADITKLAGIEDDSTADQTNIEIKNAYEANADTNEFDDAEKTKLAGITAGADPDQNIWTTFIGDTGNTTANTTTDTLAILGGTNVTTAIVGDTLTITAGLGDSLPVSDLTSIVEGNVDATKQMRIDVESNVGSGTIRIITMPNSNVDLTLVATALQDLKDDVTPQLGAMLDVNGNSLGTGALELLSFIEIGSAINEFTITNASIGNDPILSATGDDTDIGITITPKGTGAVTLDGLAYPTADGTDGQVITTDGSGTLTFGDADTKFSDTFDATTDWGSATGGFYSITIAEATHGQGDDPLIQIYEGTTTFEIVQPDEVSIAANGSITFRVAETPDNRFAGKILIL